MHNTKFCCGYSGTTFARCLGSAVLTIPPHSIHDMYLPHTRAAYSTTSKCTCTLPSRQKRKPIEKNWKFCSCVRPGKQICVSKTPKFDNENSITEQELVLQVAPFFSFEFSSHFVLLHVFPKPSLFLHSRLSSFVGMRNYTFQLYVHKHFVVHVVIYFLWVGFSSHTLRKQWHASRLFLWARSCGCQYSSFTLTDERVWWRIAID